MYCLITCVLLLIVDFKAMYNLDNLSHIVSPIICSETFDNIEEYGLACRYSTPVECIRLLNLLGDKWSTHMNNPDPNLFMQSLVFAQTQVRAKSNIKKFIKITELSHQDYQARELFDVGMPMYKWINLDNLVFWDDTLFNEGIEFVITINNMCWASCKHIILEFMKDLYFMYNWTRNWKKLPQAVLSMDEKERQRTREIIVANDTRFYIPSSRSLTKWISHLRLVRSVAAEIKSVKNNHISETDVMLRIQRGYRNVGVLIPHKDTYLTLIRGYFTPVDSICNENQQRQMIHGIRDLAAKTGIYIDEASIYRMLLIAKKSGVQYYKLRSVPVTGVNYDDQTTCYCYQ